MTDGPQDDDVTLPDGAPSAEDGSTPSEQPRGRMRQQDASTTPREPSLADKRAREQKLRADREAARLEEARSKKTRRVLIGTGATVGVVALIAAVYAAAGPDEEVTAQCVDNDGVVVSDDNCGGDSHDGRVSSGGGFALVPIFLGGGGRQYHYNYGSSSPVGTVAGGGSVTPPPAASRSGTTFRSGTTGGTISRGGLGVGGSSSSGGFGFGSSGS